MSFDGLSVLISAVVGGALGAGISAWASIRVGWHGRREAAAAALWQYHYVLAARALEAELHEAEPGPFSQTSLMKVRRADVYEALRAAYPFSGYLDEKTRLELFRRARVFDISAVAELDDATRQEAIEFRRLADTLEAALEIRFPRRRWWEKLRDQRQSGGGN